MAGSPSLENASLENAQGARFEVAFYYSFMIPDGWRVRHVWPRDEEPKLYESFEVRSDARGGSLAFDDDGTFAADMWTANGAKDVWQYIEQRAALDCKTITARRELPGGGRAIEGIVADDGDGMCFEWVASEAECEAERARRVAEHRRASEE